MYQPEVIELLKMENTDTELSGKTAAAFSWMEFLGLILLILSRTAFKQEWLFYVGALIIFGSYLYKLIRDWRAGNKKAVQRRLFILLLAVIAGALVGYFRYRNP